MKYSVMLIDDEEIILTGLKKYINWDQLGFLEPSCFSDGKDALDYLENNSVNLVITDIKMTYVSGIEVCKFIHNRCPDTKIVILSAFDNFNYAVDAINYKVEKYLLKTSTIPEISGELQKIRLALDSVFSHTVENPSNNYLINEAIKYLEENISNDISLEKVSAHLYLTPAYFSRLFKKHTNMNFKSYMINRKIEKAKELLMNPKYKIYDISISVGYRSEQFFTQTFKKYVGITPSEYRQNVIL